MQDSLSRRMALARISNTSGILAASAVSGSTAAAAPRRRPLILLRSSWQVVNIGDIAHTPGVLALIEQHLPEAEVILWASANLTEEVSDMEHRRFPNLKIVKGTIDTNGNASNAGLTDAIRRADFLLHGSGPSLVAAKDVAAWVRYVGKPFGVYGITHGSFLSGADHDLLSKASFVYFRDTPSLDLARSEGVKCPIMDFAPDGAFACDLRDDSRAEAFLNANQLESGKFLCCLSRLRYTPYWTIPGDKRPFDQKRHDRNQQVKEQDHHPIREAIIKVVHETALKVLLCPEDMTQMAVGKELLFDKLPPDVQKQVVWRPNFWLTDEALSVYVRSAGLFGSEMHSPIMAVGNGIPAIVCRFEEQTSKGLMWKDIGLGDWLFDFDLDVDRARMPEAVLQFATDPVVAKEKALVAREYVLQKQKETMVVLKSVVQ